MKTSNTVYPVRNSSPAIAGLETERGIRSRPAYRPPAYRQAGGIIIKSNPAKGGTAEQWGIISNGVNVFGVRLASMHLV